ncbi:MAG: AmmeMemoRadiSam system protein A [Chloroflexi bacterium]|nr:AmmeMemoRadiSam system protein A [Chloroflexota bacterium]
MTAVRFAGISPHPPIIVPEVGRGREGQAQRTIDALQRVGRELARHRPETIVIIATHGPLRPNAFGILTSSVAEGDFSQWGAPQVMMRYEVDGDAVRAIREEAQRAGLPLQPIDRWDLDWSVTVPLYYLGRDLPGVGLVALQVSFLPPREHFALGQAVRKAIDGLGRPAAIIASADLSHRLSEDGPYGFDPAGPEFDRRIEEAVARWDVDGVLSMPLDFRERAGDDAVPSVSFLMGALDGLAVRPRVLAHEGPWGVGYLVAAVEVGPALEERSTLVDGVETAPPPGKAEAPPEAPSHPLARLARDAVEAWVRHGQALDPADPPEDLPATAGAFVSIKTGDGRLRGCIGTTEPTQPTLAEEVVCNAIDSATRDPRFLAVIPEELPELAYSVDVLSQPEPVDGPEALDVKRYGVIVQCGGRRGLLLPDIEGVETVDQQLAIARSKACIGPDEPVQLWRFEVRRLT